MPRSRGPGCPICESVNRSLLCHNCVNNQVFNEKSSKLQQLLRERNELQQRLDSLLAARASYAEQRLQLWQQQQAAQTALTHRQRTEQRLAALRQQVQQLADSNAARRGRAEAATKELSKARAEVLGTELPRVLRYHELTLTHVRAQLAREQKHRLRELQEIFPLRINAVSKQGGPIQITICNLRLPDSLIPPPQGWPEPQAMSAALGYLLFFIDKVAMYIGGPLLHEAHHQGSTSTIWTPAGFWNRGPASLRAVLPLHVMGTSASGGAGAGGSGGSALGGAAASGGSSSGRSYARSTSLWIRGGSPPTPGSGSSSSGPGPGGGPGSSGAFLGLSPRSGAAAAAAAAHAGLHRSASSGSAGSSGGGAGSGGGGAAAARLSKRDAEVKAAWDLLMRSLRCYLKDKAHSRGLQLPPNWHPVAWLCIFCAAVKKDLRSDGRLVATAAAGAQAAAAAAAGEAAAAAAAAAAAGRGGPSPTTVAMMAAAAGEWWVGEAGTGGLDDGHQEEPDWQIEDDDDDDDEEGWGMVRTPWLPPPPSQPDEVEQWARAMFTDPNASSSSAVLAVGSPSGGSMLSMERIRFMFGKG